MLFLKCLYMTGILSLLLASSSASSAVLRKKSGRAIIMGFSKVELESFGNGQYIKIENFEKNQWTGLIRKIYRVNRVRITLIDDDAEDMEVGEVFRILPSEAPLTLARPEFDPNEFQEEPEPQLRPEVSHPAPLAESKGPPTPLLTERSPVESAPDPNRLMLSTGLVTRYYMVPAGKSEGNLHGTGPQLQGTFQTGSGWGMSLGLRQEKLVYSGVDQFSKYNVAVLVYFTGLSYTWHFSQWSIQTGLRQNLQAKGSGFLEDVFVSADQKPISVVVRGIGEVSETAAIAKAAYDWQHFSLFIETTLSLSARISSEYRWQLQGQDPLGNDFIQEYRTNSSFRTQVQGLLIGLGFTI